jgi:hypothetical protein
MSGDVDRSRMIPHISCAAGAETILSFGNGNVMARHRLWQFHLEAYPNETWPAAVDWNPEEWARFEGLCPALRRRTTRTAPDAPRRCFEFRVKPEGS